MNPKTETSECVAAAQIPQFVEPRYTSSHQENGNDDRDNDTDSKPDQHCPGEVAFVLIFTSAAGPDDHNDKAGDRKREQE